MNFSNLIKPKKETFFYDKQDDVKLAKLLLIGVFLLFVITPFKVQAESGTINYENIQTKDYTFSNSAAGRSTNFTLLRFDTTDYTLISSFRINIATAVNDFESTAFSCVNGCSGGGIAWYDKNFSRAYWVFDSGTTFSSNNVKISYSKNIFSLNVTYNTNAALDTDTTSSKPVGFFDDSCAAPGCTWYIMAFTFQSVVSTTSTDTYSVTYPMNGFFNLTVIKGGISNRYFIKNASAVAGTKQNYTQEASQSTNSIYGLISNYYDGLYLDAYYAAGGNVLTTINTSGIAVASTPTPQAGGVYNPPLTIPSSGGSIQFNQTKYVIGDTVRFEWAISNTSWNAVGSTFKVLLFKNDNAALIGDSSALDLGSQTGNYSFKPSEAAVYTVKLYGGSAWTLFSATSLLSTAYTTVIAEAPATIFINSSVPYKTQVPVTYNFGVGGINGLDYAIQTFYFDRVKNEYQFEHSYFGLSPSGTKNVFFENLGTYIIKLKNVKTGKEYSRTTTETTFTFPDTVLNILTSSLKISKSSYSYGNTLVGNYTVDNTNFTSGITYIDVFNVDQQAVTSEFYGSGSSWSDTSKQLGDVFITLLNVPKSENFPSVTFLDGNNNLRLMMKNSTGNRTVLAVQNFTLSSVTDTGYGLRLSKNLVQVNEQFFAYVTTPESAKLILVDTSTDSTKGILLSKVNQSKTIPLAIKKVGSYAILLQNPANDTEVMQNIEVVAAVPKTTTPQTPDQVVEANSKTTTLSKIDGWTAMFGLGVNAISKFLFAITWIIGFTLMGFIMTKGSGTGGVITGFIPYAFFTFINYVPQWFIVVALIILAQRLGWFR